MNVKQLRSQLNLTQHELSTVTGIPRDRIAKWEQGKGSPKGYDSQLLERLQSALDSMSALEGEIKETAQIIPALKFGIAVKKKREKAGMTWEELGTLLKLDPVFIQCTERGLMDVGGPEIKPIWDWAGINPQEKPESISYSGRISVDADNPKPERFAADRYFTADQIFAMFLEVSKAQTTILGRIENKMAQESTQAKMKEDVTLVLETLRTVAARQEADEETILHSLGRIEGLPEKKLFQDAGRRKSQIEKTAAAFGNGPV